MTFDINNPETHEVQNASFLFCHLLERTNMLEIFFSLLTSYYNNKESLIKISPPKDDTNLSNDEQDLIDLIEMISGSIFSVSTNLVIPDDATMRYNCSYYTMGLLLDGKDDFPRPDNPYTDFRPDLQDALIMAMAIRLYGQTSDDPKFASPGQLASKLETIKINILNRHNNSVIKVNKKASMLFNALLALLLHDKFAEELDLPSSGTSSDDENINPDSDINTISIRLKALGAKVGIAADENTPYLIRLAFDLDSFLGSYILNSNDQMRTGSYLHDILSIPDHDDYDGEMFPKLSDNYARVYGVDLKAIALSGKSSINPPS